MARQRRPQINFQVTPSMKTLYEEARLHGHWVTRLCAAGFLLVVEDPALRRRALQRLREWEARFDQADPEQIRTFVADAEAVMTGAAPESRPARKVRRGQKRAKRSGS
jgi:hypothetical protein